MQAEVQCLHDTLPNFAKVADDVLQSRRILRVPNVLDRAGKHGITMSQGGRACLLRPYRHASRRVRVVGPYHGMFMRYALHG